MSLHLCLRLLCRLLHCCKPLSKYAARQWSANSRITQPGLRDVAVKAIMTWNEHATKMKPHCNYYWQITTLTTTAITSHYNTYNHSNHFLVHHMPITRHIGHYAHSSTTFTCQSHDTLVTTHTHLLLSHANHTTHRSLRTLIYYFHMPITSFTCQSHDTLVTKHTHLLLSHANHIFHMPITRHIGH